MRELEDNRKYLFVRRFCEYSNTFFEYSTPRGNKIMSKRSRRYLDVQNRFDAFFLKREWTRIKDE